VSLGAAGSLVVTIEGARLGGGNVLWWFHPRLLSGGDANRIVFYAGMVALAVAWLGLGRVANASNVTPSQLAAVAIVWCLPLAAGAPLFSRDVYSYLAQGTIAHLGANPYSDPPSVLRQLGHPEVLNAVDRFWQDSTAPYGPLFLGVVSLIAAVAGSHLVLAVLMVRGFDLLGLVLLAIFVPRLARRLGADPARALWLAVLSPLVLLQLVAPAHNDLLMAGVMLAGVTLALEGRPLVGIAACALAATIKVPALAAVIFVAVGWIRAEPAWRSRLAAAVKAAAAVLGTAAAVSLITGFGVDWVSTGLFSTPAKVRLAITPATDISWTIAPWLHGLGLAPGFRQVESVARVVAVVATTVVALFFLRREELRLTPRYLGLALLAFALGGPAVWPWYFSWGLVLLAAWRPAQTSRVLIGAVLLGSFLVKPGGILILPLGSSPVIAALWILAAVLGCYRWWRAGRRPRGVERPEAIGPARSAFAEN
jgi:hypothetical protein